MANRMHLERICIRGQYALRANMHLVTTHSWGEYALGENMHFERICIQLQHAFGENNHSIAVCIGEKIMHSMSVRTWRDCVQGDSMNLGRMFAL